MSKSGWKHNVAFPFWVSMTCFGKALPFNWSTQCGHSAGYLTLKVMTHLLTSCSSVAQELDAGQGFLIAEACRQHTMEMWSAQRRDLYVTTENAHKRQTSMIPTGFPPPPPKSSCSLFVLFPYLFLCLDFLSCSFVLLHNTIQTSMTPAGYAPAIPASERPQANALDLAAKGIVNFESAITARDRP